MNNIKLQPPAVFLIFILAMWAVHLIVPVKTLLSRPLNFIGVFFIADGLTAVLWAAKLYPRIEDAFPSFTRPVRLITEGPYQFTRNPVYLGMAGMLLGVGMVLGSLMPLVLPFIFVKIMEQKYVLPEEDALERRFGDRYREYKDTVRRWI